MLRGRPPGSGGGPERGADGAAPVPPYRWPVDTASTDALPQGEDKARAVRAMFDTIAPRYDLVNRIMTFRMDVGWRRRTVRSLDLGARSVVLDLACGTGDLCIDLQRGGHRPIGADLSFGMLAAARTDAPLVHGDGLHLPFPDASIDGVTCGFALRNFVALPPMLAELARILRPGGRIALLDVAEPPNPLMRLGHSVYFGRVVPLIGGLLSDKAAYRYLPKSVAYLPEPLELERMIADAGFVDVDRTLLSGGISQLYNATRS
jgi:demethylmenaquinone methyltransferase / 2-methoxy-6-polyprenyl-1,4-benzoquinol methylase